MPVFPILRSKVHFLRRFLKILRSFLIFFCRRVSARLQVLEALCTLHTAHCTLHTTVDSRGYIPDSCFRKSVVAQWLLEMCYLASCVVSDCTLTAHVLLAHWTTMHNNLLHSRAHNFTALNFDFNVLHWTSLNHIYLYWLKIDFTALDLTLLKLT